MRYKITSYELLCELLQHVPVEDVCMEWPRRLYNGGPGRIQFAGKLHVAHRLAYEIAFGPVAADLFVCHRCDNPPCFRPSHMFLGSQTDNMRDAVRKGRKGHNRNTGKPATSIAANLTEHCDPHDKLWNYELLKTMLKAIPKDDSCMEWPRAKTTSGYGSLKSRHTAARSVHRAAYELAVGPIPNGLCALHRCDNRACFRPSHLFLGTKLDNSRDCTAKGRALKSHGENVNTAKLNEERVREIRELHAQGWTQRLLVEKFGVGQTQISRIILRQHWRHVA